MRGLWGFVGKISRYEENIVRREGTALVGSGQLIGDCDRNLKVNHDSEEAMRIATATSMELSDGHTIDHATLWELVTRQLAIESAQNDLAARLGSLHKEGWS